VDSSQLAPGQKTVVLTEEGFRVNGPVDLDFVKITAPPGDGLTLATNATGVIRRVEIDTWTADGIKIQNAGTVAHDFQILGGYVRAHAIAGSVHQDGCQAMGGRNILFRNLVFDTLGNGNLFIKRGGSGASTPTNIVAEHCAFGPRCGTPLYVEGSISSGARNSLVCRAPRFGRSIVITSDAVTPVNVNNTISDPLSFEALMAWVGQTAPPPPDPDPDPVDPCAGLRSDLVAAQTARDAAIQQALTYEGQLAAANRTLAQIRDILAA
jgi:hypothetical protein